AVGFIAGGFISTSGIAGAFVGTFLGKAIGWYRTGPGAPRRARSSSWSYRACSSADAERLRLNEPRALHLFPFRVGWAATMGHNGPQWVNGLPAADAFAKNRITEV